ncbi:MAG: iron-only hydrogenase system regulator [Lachnospiraceae bacterium]|nr:iron-only hydrogenase system regulator [Lachnospiraceae bacterium]MBR4412545.1 iron-only hydrogenase system regulator [Lachnospiraceae bacterium]MBR5066883.1 iron-only hydrogenase system regulator [Lachnospiraceae bacterium]MBR5917518.1 iron-only hydrogenase system regulator [Lachnospiraceae bacterium]
METRAAVIAIIVKDNESAGEINSLLHEYCDFVIGRMGIPYREKGINIISVAVDAPQDTISSLAGKIGRIKGVTAKTVYSPTE